MRGRYRAVMRNTTMIVPVGPLTPELSQRIRDLALARAQQDEVLISLRSLERCSWSALCLLADFVRASITPYRIRLNDALPRTRALLRELGLESAAFAGQGAEPANRCIVVS
jgi:hypothetical protein